VPGLACLSSSTGNDDPTTIDELVSLAWERIRTYPASRRGSVLANVDALGSGNGAHDCRRPSGHVEPREAEQRLGIEEMHQRSFVGRDGPPHRSRRCRRGRGSTSTTGRSASATEPSADVRLDGDQMTADPDDGDAGHVSAASISLRARGDRCRCRICCQPVRFGPASARELASSRAREHRLGEGCAAHGLGRAPAARRSWPEPGTGWGRDLLGWRGCRPLAGHTNLANPPPQLDVVLQPLGGG
jgi:hypothetical protein